MPIDVVEIPFQILRGRFTSIVDITLANAGGMIDCPRFLSNPMYTLEVHEDMKLRFRVELTDPDSNCLLYITNIRSASLSDPRDIDNEDLGKAGSIKVYNAGLTEMVSSLEKGLYCLIVSIHDPREELSMKMKLHVDGLTRLHTEMPETVQKPLQSEPFKLEPLTFRDNLGTLTRLEGFWQPVQRSGEGSARGSTSHDILMNPGYNFGSGQQQEFRVRMNIRSKTYEQSFNTHRGLDHLAHDIEAPALIINVYMVNSPNDYTSVYENYNPMPTAWGHWTP